MSKKETAYTAERIEISEREILFNELFGSSKYKGMPIAEYAECIFHMGLEQMIHNYQRSEFEFIKITNADVDIETTGFAPCPIEQDADKMVTITTPTGTTGEMTLASASLIVWAFVLTQVQFKITDKAAHNRISRTYQDFAHCRGQLYVLGLQLIPFMSDSLLMYKPDDQSLVRQAIN